MGVIKLKNIRLYCYHGCLKEETLIGSDYLVNLKVTSSLGKASKTDHLQDTVDYVYLNAIVKREMAIPSKLLEHVAKRIIDGIFNELPTVNNVKISVAKINPPIGGDVEAVSVTLKETRK